MSEKAKTEAEVRATGIRQLEGIIGCLTDIKNSIEAGTVHYHDGALTVTEENDCVIQSFIPGLEYQLPGPKTWRIRGDVTFGTEKKEQTNEPT